MNEENTINNTPNSLMFRAALGTQLNTGSRTSIHPRVTGSISQITESFDGNSAFYISNPNFVANKEKIYQDQVAAGIKNRVTDKMEVESTIVAESPYGFASGSQFPTPSGKNALSPFQSIQTTSYTSQSYTPDVNYLEVAFSPQNQINDDINAQLGYFNIGDYIGDPRQISSSARSYPDLDQLRNAYFEKYIKSYDVVDFVRLMKFFDNSLFKMIKDFTPARTSLSSGVVVKQHILERNRQRPAQTSWSNETYSGSIKPQSRNYDTGSGDVGAYESTDGSSIYKFSGGTGGSFERFNGLQTSPQPILSSIQPTLTYNLVNVATGKYLGAAASSAQPVVARDYGNTNDTQWKLTQNSDGFYNIDSLDNGVLRATGPNFDPQWAIVSTNREPPVFDSDKEFRLEYDDTDNTWKIRVSNTGMFVKWNGVDGFIGEGGYNTGDDAKWKLIITPPIYNNRFGITQSFSESIKYSVADRITNKGSFQGYRDVTISNQKEFYDGEFSGSNLEVTDSILNPDCAPYLKINTTSILFRPIFFGSNFNRFDGGTVSIDEFLDSNNSPVSGDAWIISERSTLIEPEKVRYIKLSATDVNGIFIRDYLDASNTLQLILPEGNAKYYIEGSETFSTHVLLRIKQDIGDITITGSANGGSENWSLTAYGDFRVEGNTDEESQGSFKNSAGIAHSQSFWYYNGDVADAQSFFNTGSSDITLNDIINNPLYYGYGSYNPKRTSNINWFVSCSIDYSASLLSSDGNEITQSGDFYRGYKYEGLDLTDQDFILNSSTTESSFIPSPYSINLPDGQIFLKDYNTQIPGNSGSADGEIGGNVKIGIAGTASFKYVANTDGALKFNIVQNPQTVPSAQIGYSSILGGGLKTNNGNFSGNFPIPAASTRFYPGGGGVSTSNKLPIIQVPQSSLRNVFANLNEQNFPSANVEFEFSFGYTASYSGSSGDDGQLYVDIFYSSSNFNTDNNPDPSTFISIGEESSITPGNSLEYGEGELLFYPADLPHALNNSEWDWLFFGPQFKVEDADDIKYSFDNFSIDVFMNDSVSGGTGLSANFQIAVNVSQSSPTYIPLDGWNVYDTNYITNPSNPRVKAKWSLNVTGSNGDEQLYELPETLEQPHPTIELNGPGPITVGFNTVDWGVINPHTSSINDMYYLKYTLYGYTAGTDGGATSTSFNFQSIDNTGNFDTLQISQSVILQSDDWDLTGSLRMYRGTEDNPEGEILVSRQFIVPSENSTGTFAFTSSLYNLPADFRYNDTYRMGVEVSKSFASGLDITAYTMSIFPSQSKWAPLTSPPEYDNYKQPTDSGVFIPSYFGADILPFNKAVDCQPTLNNYNDIRSNSFIMDVDYGSSKTTTLDGFEIYAGEKYLYPGNVSTTSILENVRIGQFISTPNNENVFPSNTKVIGINFESAEIELSNAALSTHEFTLSVTFSTNDLVPTNQEQLIDKTAAKASIPDSNYTSLRSINPRYNGVKTTSNQLNIWSIKDTNTYGQNPVIELRDAYFGFFRSIKDLYPLVNDKISLDVTYLLDQQSNAIPPNLEENGVDILTKTFPNTNNVTLGFISSSGFAQELDDSYSVFKLTQQPIPVLYSQTSSAGYSDDIPLTGSGRVSMYDNNDGSSFEDYSFTAQGTSSWANNNGDNGSSVQFGTYTQSINPSEDISTNPYNSDNYTDPYNNPFNDGIMTFSPNSGRTVEGNPQIISMQTSFATSFLYESGTSELNVDIRMLSGSTGVNFELEDITLKVYRTGQDPVDAGSIIESGINNLLRFVGDKIITQRRGFFRRSRRVNEKFNEIYYNNTRQSYCFIVENNPLNEFLKQKGLYTGGRGGSKSKGDITGLEFIIKANSGNFLIENNDQIKFHLTIDMPKSKESAGNVLFPDDYTGPIFPAKISTIGERTALLEGDNVGSAPFWVYTGSAGGDSNILDQSILVMSSSNINEAYGGAFYQGPLSYEPGSTEYFDSGVEPAGTQFPKITSPIEFFSGDEIRFGNNENHSYEILEVTPPESNIEGDSKGRVKIKLNKKVPKSINKDFFLIRRYTPKASSLIINASFPYSAESSGSNANGIIYPTFPTKYIQNSGSVIVTDLISKGVIQS